MPYKTDDIARIAKISPQTLRNWISKGLLPIAQSGRGKSAELQEHEVVMILVAAEFSRLGIGPSVFSPLLFNSDKPIFPIIMLHVTQILGVIRKGAYWPDSFKNKLCVIFRGSESISCELCESIDAVRDKSDDVTRIVVDILQLAEKAYSLFIELPKA